MNPELQRNLWLEWSAHRLIAMPGVLTLLFLLAALSAPAETPERLTTTGLVLFLGLAGVWGTRRSAEAITEEWRSKTWDGQRLSALGAWEMTWGKLLGSTAFAWYGAIPCLVVVALAWPSWWTYTATAVIVSAVCSAIALQACGLLISLLAARKGRLARARGLWVVPLLLLFSGLSSRLFTVFSADVLWWGYVWEGLYFGLASAMVWAAWAVFGAYRLMCQELQVRTTPWAWAAFVLFLAWYLAGFVPRGQTAEGLFVYVLAAFLVAGVLTYLMLFSERTELLMLRRLRVRLQRREWRRALEDMPCWLVSLALVTACTPLLLLLAPARELVQLEATQKMPEFQHCALPLLLLLYRDTAIFLSFALAQVPRRVETTTLFYLGLLYLILPGLCLLLELRPLCMLLLPPVFTQPLLAAAILLGHVVLALSCLGYRWRQSSRVRPLSHR
ncbi:MAG: hypothetical protein AB7N91_22300 [Candidatus Tectimicrobiota bacterium]